MTSPVSPNPHLSANKTKWDSVIPVLQGYCVTDLLPQIHQAFTVYYLLMLRTLTNSVDDMCIAFVTGTFYTWLEIDQLFLHTNNRITNNSLVPTTQTGIFVNVLSHITK